MLFSSVTFIFYFLPLVLIIYYFSKDKMKNYILLFFSLIFYAWGGVAYLPILLMSILINYILGLKIDKYKESNKKQKIILILAIIFNIAFLGIFKYTNFIFDNINLIFNSSINVPLINLPIGISFYTFQAMSYVIDVYRGDGKVQKNIFNLALYISMFPQLVAGPIVRYETVDEQIKFRTYNLEKFNYGFERFIIGLFKKVIISNSVGEMSMMIYALGDSDITILTAWLGVIGYTLQIFFDFSGYSDMAIGLGKMFGFDFLENFNYPYISRSVGEFWRRWHISLGSWFRDYIYIPLGGNRVKRILVYRNLAIVWFITGLWHGASWNFIVWGLYFGIFIILEKVFLNKFFNKIPRFFSHIYLLVVVIFSWVLFSKPDIRQAIEYISIMLGFGHHSLLNGYTSFFFKQYFFEIIIAILMSVPLGKYFIKNKKIYRIINYIKPIILILIFVITIIYLVNSTFNPFIYFNF